jgi:hypothetical protein
VIKTRKLRRGKTRGKGGIQLSSNHHPRELLDGRKA